MSFICLQELGSRRSRPIVVTACIWILRIVVTSQQFGIPVPVEEPFTRLLSRGILGYGIRAVAA